MEWYGGNEPNAKKTDPMANKIPIHHPIAPGAHQVDPKLLSRLK